MAKTHTHIDALSRTCNDSNQRLFEVQACFRMEISKFTTKHTNTHIRATSKICKGVVLNTQITSLYRAPRCFRALPPDWSFCVKVQYFSRHHSDWQNGFSLQEFSPRATKLCAFIAFASGTCKFAFVGGLSGDLSFYHSYWEEATISCELCTFLLRAMQVFLEVYVPWNSGHLDFITSDFFSRRRRDINFEIYL